MVEADDTGWVKWKVGGEGRCEGCEGLSGMMG